MSYLLATIDTLAAAATDVDGIAAAIQAANAAAAGPTSGLLAAAGDEVSAAVSALFNAYGAEYQAVVRQLGAFQSEFTRTLAAASNAYAQAEAAAVQALVGPTTGAALPAAATNVALIMGGTNNPLPIQEYIDDIRTNWLSRLYSGVPSFGLLTPQQFWPVTPDIGTMTYSQSVAKGVAALHSAIQSQIGFGNSPVVFGYSQSASIINNEILNLMANGSPYHDELSFIMAAAGNNPNGGLLARFPGFYLPILDVPFNGATPANNPYETLIYTAQYDGVAHAPQYPTNILADVNALMGYFYVHNQYPTLNPLDAVQLPTSPGYDGATKYYMFLTQDLPLLQPIRDIPYAGPPIADIFQPALRVMVDLGYSDYGYADLPTPAGLINIPNPFAVAYHLGQSLWMGPYGAAVEIGVEAGFWGPEHFPDAYPWVPSTNPGLNFYLGPQFSQPPVTLLSTVGGALGNVLHIIPPIFN